MVKQGCLGDAIGGPGGPCGHIVGLVWPDSQIARPQGPSYNLLGHKIPTNGPLGPPIVSLLDPCNFKQAIEDPLMCMSPDVIW